LIAVMTVLFWPGEKEPVYQGKKLSEWWSQYETFFYANGPVNPPELQEAETAIRAIGTNAIPYFLKWIQYESPPWRDGLKDAIDKLPSFLSDSSVAEKITRNRADECADRVALGFAILGESAITVAPQLAKFLDDPKYPDTGGRVLRALPWLGKDGMGIILHRMADANCGVRCAAIRALGWRHSGTNMAVAVPLLIGALHSANEREAAFAASSLGSLQLQPDLVVPALVRCLEAGNPPDNVITVTAPVGLDRRAAAVGAIGNFGPAARCALPKLQEIANNANDWMHAWAQECIGRIETRALRTNGASVR
jgi:hypothetical protein